MITNIIGRFLKKGSVILDVGGGNGFVSANLLRNGYSPIVLEPGLKGAYNAKKKGISAVVCGTLETANFEMNSCEAIGVFDVIEHIENDVEMLHALRQLLMENGLLVITVPSFSWLWSDEDVAAGHFRRYSGSGIKKKLEQCGFEVVYKNYFFVCLVPVLYFLRALPSKFKLYKVDVEFKDHKRPSWLLRNALNFFLWAELKLLQCGLRFPVGTSCVVVAQPKPN